jgi:hypothetical protein
MPLDDDKTTFFRRFISFDLTDQNDGFDSDSAQWFSPADMEIAIKRLWFLGGRPGGMDVAEDVGPGNGARGSRWGIAAGISPRERSELDAWLTLLKRETLIGCIVSISYDIPQPAIDLFLHAQHQ